MLRIINESEDATNMMNGFEELMLNNMELQNEPSVGCFWFDVNKKVLFGVNSTLASDVPYAPNSFFGSPTKTGRKLHYQIWSKETHRKKDHRFSGDYTKIPRGRVFEVEGRGFVICVGSWIENYPEAEELIIDEFDLPVENTEILIDEHWNVGHGWSNDFLQ